MNWILTFTWNATVSYLQVLDCETLIAQLRNELDVAQTHQRSLKEDLADREGQLRVAQMNLDTSKKQNQLHMQEVGNHLE